MWTEITTKQEVSNRELSYIIEEILKMMCAGELQELDDLLRDMDVEKTSIVVMIACLRTPFLVRDQLPHWKTYLQRCQVSFQNLGEDADELCRGLL